MCLLQGNISIGGEVQNLQPTALGVWNWGNIVDADVLAAARQFRLYDTTSFLEFLCLIWNLHSHYVEHARINTVWQKLGTLPEGLSR